MVFKGSQKRRMSNDLVDEATDLLSKLLRAANADETNEAISEEIYRLNEQTQTLETLGAVFAFHQRNHSDEQAKTKRVFEVVNEVYNKSRAS